MGPVFTKSSRQKLNRASSMEAELVGVADMLPQILWSREWLLEQGYSVGPAKLFQEAERGVEHGGRASRCGGHVATDIVEQRVAIGARVQCGPGEVVPRS
jgi:hypothetical protein